MASLHDQLRGLVYSTEHGDVCPGCRHAVAECRCTELAEQERIAALDGIVRIRRETSGRKGKGVTTISGLPLPHAELQALAKLLKKLCGTGGSVQAGIIEIQGDHRARLQRELEHRGYSVKLAGG